MLRWLFAALHLIALGIGLGAVWARARALRGPFNEAAFGRIFYADSLWGLSAILWIGTGLTRVLASMEKSAIYYMQNHLFWLKMTLLAIILVLEIRVAMGLVRWRRQLARGITPDTGSAGTFATISVIEALIVIAMVFVATGMARGYGM
ncbi:MAG TPA: DUF2214 family protein [Gemmatimonadaceae bacterium]|nr:DUF2214 family protein [Gemmatimonadaceae bacterium]